MDTNKSTLTLAEHINKCPYDIGKKIYKILVKDENVLGVVRLLAGAPKSLRYELWADYMQKMPMGEFLHQIDYYHLSSFKCKFRCIMRELRESIGHRDDMTRWSYTQLSETDRQAIKNPLLSIIETETDTAFIFNERNLHEYCKRLPCSMVGYFPWGAFKLDIIHMILDYIVHSHYQDFHAICLTDIVKKVYAYSRYRDFRSVKYDYDIPLASNGTETIAGAFLYDWRRQVGAGELYAEFYELMPAPIDYRHLWKAFVEDIVSELSIIRNKHYQLAFGQNLPIYRTRRRKTFYLNCKSDSVAPKKYYLGDERAFKRIESRYSKYLESLRGSGLLD